MRKFLCFLMLFIAVETQAQQLDSVLINNEWRYVYPIKQKVEFNYKYYDIVKLPPEHLKIWMEWKAANDPRAELGTKDLRNATQLERFKRLESLDSTYNDYLSSREYFPNGGFRRFSKVSKRDIRKNPDIVHYPIEKPNADIPPVVANLPDGKYVLYYEDYVNAEKYSRTEINSNRVACLFELIDNELNNSFVKQSPLGDTLFAGNYKESFKEGEWFEVFFLNETDKYKKYSYSYRKVNYVAGIKNGRLTGYYANGDRNIVNFSNGFPVGNVTMITAKDSAVFDFAYISNDTLNQLASRIQSRQENFEDHNYRKTERDRKRLFKELRKSPNYRSEQGIISNYRIISEMEELVLNGNDLSYEYNEYGSSHRFMFNSFFKIYDRSTQQLIYERYLDAKTANYWGSSYSQNGMVYDTVWVTGKYVNKIVTGLNGEEIYPFNQKESVHIRYKKPKKYRPQPTIEGFAVRELSYLFKPDYYSFQSKVHLKRDTLIKEIYWNKKEQRILTHFEIDGKEGMIFQLKDGSKFTYTEAEIEHVKLEKEDIAIEFDTKDGEVSNLKILSRGVPFEGEFTLIGNKKYSIKQKRSALEISIGRLGKKQFYRINSRDFAEVNTVRLDRMACRGLLNGIMKLKVPSIDFENISGNVKNNQFEGPVLISTKNAADNQLVYRNGLASGVLNLSTKTHLKKKERYVSSKLIMNYQSQTQPAAKKSDRKFLRTAYGVKNGKIDGPFYQFWMNDTVTSLNYSNGVLVGKALVMHDRVKLQANFSEGRLIGDFTIDEMVRGEAKRVFSTTITSDGLCTNGKQYDEVLNSKLERVFIATEFEQTSSNSITSKIYLNNELQFSVVGGFDGVEKIDVYHLGLLHYTILEPEKRYFAYKYLDILNLMMPEGNIDPRNPVSQLNFQLSRLGSIGLTDYYIKEMKSQQRGYITKYFPNGKIAFEGLITARRAGYHDIGSSKTGTWKTYKYNGDLWYTIDYMDTLLDINGYAFPIYGVQMLYDSLLNPTCERYLTNEVENYECTNNEYYATQEFITYKTYSDSAKWNGKTYEYYANGALMSEGLLKNGVPEGLWKVYTPDGKLKSLGKYKNGKKHGKWLLGDLSDKAYFGEICIDPDDPNYDYLIKNFENNKEIDIEVYNMGVQLTKSQFTDKN